MFARKRDFARFAASIACRASSARCIACSSASFCCDDLRALLLDLPAFLDQFTRLTEGLEGEQQLEQERHGERENDRHQRRVRRRPADRGERPGDEYDAQHRQARPEQRSATDAGDRRENSGHESRPWAPADTTRASRTRRNTRSRTSGKGAPRVSGRRSNATANTRPAAIRTRRRRAPPRSPAAWARRAASIRRRSRPSDIRRSGRSDSDARPDARSGGPQRSFLRAGERVQSPSSSCCLVRSRERGAGELP